jgi:putative membrane protein
MLLRDALLAFVHFALILTLAGLLLSELALYQRTMARASLNLLQRIDLGYGIVAGLVVLSGLARMYWGLKGPTFYTHNPAFWIKMGLFGTIALLSLAPTLHYIRIGSRDGDSIEIEAPAYRGMRRFLIAEAVLLLLLPLFAALMARGL